MAELEGHDAFAAISRALAGDADITAWSALEPAFERLRAALSETPQRASQLDLVVLLRQALAFEHSRRGYAVAPTVLIAQPRFAGFQRWDEVGLQASAASAGVNVTPVAWRPDWLVQHDDLGVDAFATSEALRREFNAKNCEGDPFLASVGRTSYRSRGQRAAVRAALSTPAGGTLVVALPTGEGKSMIFQLAQAVGFVGARHPEGRGVTLVVVPTVALAVNHEQEAVNVCGLSKPLAFQGGSETQNGIIADRIADGSQGLCFASPEAACGRLRESLRRAAEAGHLRALVVDEAHLVDQWGTGFRTEFQELSGLRRELISSAPPDQRMRTLLLSATLTESSLETLRALFGTDGDFNSLAAVQLRPEPDYWVAAAASEAVRTERIMEALHHAPRPAVLYVTEVAEAEAWRQRLFAAGFRRYRKLDGKTSRTEREEIVGQWRDGRLDLVVGTSAFGLGIDYPHARSVIHACVPETLDRFYQEVGRGGRDGRASFSLIAPANKDFATAERINAQKVIGLDRGMKRWTTMFERKLATGADRFAVRIDGRPGADDRDIDMFGDTNTDWNLRVLALMARAALIRLLGSPYPRPAAQGEWLEIEVLDDSHLDLATWQQRVEPVRRESWSAGRRNLALMRAFLAGERCPAELLGELYGDDRVGRICSRCSVCREDPARRHRATSVGEPLSPWVEPLDPGLARLFDRNLRLLVTYDPAGLPRAASRRLAETLGRLQKLSLAKMLVLGAPPFDLTRVMQFAETLPFFVTEVASLAVSRLPRGPELVLVGPDQRLEVQNLAPRPETPRIFVAPEKQLAPDGRHLRDVFGGRTLTLEEFHARVAQ